MRYGSQAESGARHRLKIEDDDRTIVEYRLEGSNHDDLNPLARDDCDADKDQDWNENTSRRPEKVNVA